MALPQVWWEHLTPLCTQHCSYARLQQSPLCFDSQILVYVSVLLSFQTTFPNPRFPDLCRLPWPSPISQEPSLVPPIVPNKILFPPARTHWHQHRLPQQSIPFKPTFKTPLNTFPFRPPASSWKLSSCCTQEFSLTNIYWLFCSRPWGTGPYTGYASWLIPQLVANTLKNFYWYLSRPLGTALLFKFCSTRQNSSFFKGKIKGYFI